MKWLDRIPLALIAIVAILLAVAPFGGEPHLWQKLKMLFAGSLAKPIDIADLFLHGVPTIFLAIKLVRVVRARSAGVSGR